MQVNLFIYTDSIIFQETPLTCDTTLISCDSTEYTADQTESLERVLAMTAKKIDLFSDEKISVNSSISNINDISKIFTDYSNSFTIPASQNNNQIFKHWYENSLNDGFNQNKRYDGYIEIDTIQFRVGKWQIESASVKDNKIENYKITFYGNLLSLTDKFKEDKLKDLNTLNDYTITYTGANVQNAITSTTANNVMFPLISSNRIWQYGSGDANDISISGGAINFNELFPAVKLPRILDAIETKYNVNFSGTFLSDDRFTNAYLWFKNNEQATLNPLTQSNVFLLNNYDGGFYQTSNNEMTINYFGWDPYESQFRLSINITFPSSVTSNLLIYKDGALLTTITQTGTSNGIVIDESVGAGTYNFKIQTNVSTSYTTNYTTSYFEVDPYGPSQTRIIESENGSGSLSANLDLTSFAPDMKLTDLFSGILKMFNLTAFSTDGINFTIEQLENWYYLGKIKDFSEYTISDDFDYTRIKPYKKVNFEFEKSGSIFNRNFSDVNSREYGDLTSTFNTDGSDYTIKLPFENLLFNKFNGNNLQVCYCVKPDFSKYVPKPIILYRYERASCSFYLNNGTTSQNITNYNVFGQDVKYQLQNNSLNWGYEISSYLLSIVNNTLFSNYYLAYLSNLYSLKSRMLKVKMHLPYLELLNLKLNDRIIIRDKRYIINQFTTDLTTFECDFELIQDFRSINFNNSSLTNTDNTSKIIDISTTSATPLTWSIESDIDAMVTGISFNDLGVKIEIKPNISGLQRTASIISNLNDRIIIVQNG